MSSQLSTSLYVPLASLQIVDGADVVEAATRHEGATGRVGTAHYPAGAQRDSVHLVSGVAVPDYKLPVLGSADQMLRIAGPMESVYFREMAL